MQQITVISLRRFEPADQDAVRAVIEEGMRSRWGAAFDREMNTDIHDLATTYRDATIIVAEVGGAIAGVGMLASRGDGTSEIKRMATRSGFRRRGVASTIVRELVSLAAEARCRRVVLSTHRDWDDAARLYRSLGFVETARGEISAHFEMVLAG